MIADTEGLRSSPAAISSVTEYGIPNDTPGVCVWIWIGTVCWYADRPLAVTRAWWRDWFCKTQPRPRRPNAHACWTCWRCSALIR